MAHSRSVTASELASDSALHWLKSPGDFLDCYSVPHTATPREAAAVITAFPSWVGGLLRLRNLLVGPFGLLPEGPADQERIGPFPIKAEDEREIIAGFDDRHLDFRVSIRSEAGRVSLATWVHTHNIGGRLYLRAILPFHILIARNALHRLARA